MRRRQMPVCSRAHAGPLFLLRVGSIAVHQVGRPGAPAAAMTSLQRADNADERAKMSISRNCRLNHRDYYRPAASAR